MVLFRNDYMGKTAVISSGEHNGKMDVVAVASDKRPDLFAQTVYANAEEGTFPRRQVNKPRSIRPKRTVVQFPIRLYYNIPPMSMVSR